jgi:acetyl esterase/lipase
MLKNLPLILSFIAFLAVVWIIVPAPAYFVWLFSVAASEWSLWLGAFSIMAMIVSVCIPIFGGNGKLWIVPLIVSFTALIISLYPFLSVWELAKEQKISLSLSEYFSGLINVKDSERDFTTHTFANIDGKDLKLDVYSPTVKNENHGASVIVIHGGSWNAGERNDFPRWNRWLAAKGFTVFDIDYRIAPQPNYKTATGDVKCAVRWIKENASDFSISTERIALLGRSAGGHLALLVAYSADDSRLSTSCRENVQTETVRAVISFYAPVDLLWAFDNHANEYVIDGPKTLSAFLGGDPHQSNEIRDRYLLASPIHQVTANTPPTLLLHGGKDQLVRPENMEFLDEKLKQNKIPHKSIFIPYAQHGFDYNFHGWGSQITKSVMLEFLIENTKPGI